MPAFAVSYAGFTPDGRKTIEGSLKTGYVDTIDQALTAGNALLADLRKAGFEVKVTGITDITATYLQ